MHIAYLTITFFFTSMVMYLDIYHNDLIIVIYSFSISMIPFWWFSESSQPRWLDVRVILAILLYPDSSSDQRIRDSRYSDLPLIQCWYGNQAGS